MCGVLVMSYHEAAVRYNGSMPVSRPPITESPWFWACLFASMGLVALWAMGPKYGDRQLLEERKAQGRMRAAERAVGGEMQTEVSREGDLEIPLRPLYAILSAALMIAWALLWWSHIRPQMKERPDQDGDPPGAERPAAASSAESAHTS